MPGTGPSPADLAFYGEAPGADEEAEGRPFIGQAGRVFDSCLSNAGLDREEVYVTNVVRCRPPGNRAPLPDEQRACMIYTARELAAVYPKLLIALGGKAARALTGKDKVGDNRGKLLPLLPEYRSETPVLVTYHPAAYLHQGRNPQVLRMIEADLRFAQRVIGSTGDLMPPVVTGGPEVADTLRTLATADRLGCDLEWEVVAPGAMWPWSTRAGRTPRLVAVGLGGYVDGKPLAISLPADSAGRRAALRLIGKVPTVYHNAPGDLVWLLSVGAAPVIAGDSLLLASLLNVPGSLALETLSTTYTPALPWKMETARGRGKKGKALVGQMPVAEEDWERLLVRNGLDALVTLQLEDRLREIAHEQGRDAVLPLYTELLGVTHTLAQVALTGVPIDAAMLRRGRDTAAGRLVGLRQQIASLLGVPEYVRHGRGSDRAVAEALERMAGIKLPRTPKTNEPSITLGILADLTGHPKAGPVVAVMVRRSRLEKLHGTYLAPTDYLLEQQGDGRLHTMYKLWLARTGRSSAEQDMGGTLQQWPRGNTVRRLVCARPGWKILSADESQVELRIGAWVANERTMLRLINQGVDLHRATSGYILNALPAGVSPQQYLADLNRWVQGVTPDQRQSGKVFNFGFLFGMREGKFIDHARSEYGMIFTPAEAVAARRGYFTLYPDLTAWHEAAWNCVRQGYVDTPLGRRRPLILAEGEDEQGLQRKAINTPVQSTASDLSLLAMYEIGRSLVAEGLADLALLIGFIHDAVLLEVRDDVIEDTWAIVKHHMEHPPLERLGVALPVPLVADRKVGQTWAG